MNTNNTERETRSKISNERKKQAKTLLTNIEVDRLNMPTTRDDDIAAIRKAIDSLDGKFNDNAKDIKKLTQSYDSLSKELGDIKSAIEDLKGNNNDLSNNVFLIKSRLDTVEDTHNNYGLLIQQQNNQLNTLAQINLSSKAIIHSIPNDLEIDQVLHDMSSWADFKLDESTLNSSALIPSKNKNG